MYNNLNDKMLNILNHVSYLLNILYHLRPKIAIFGTKIWVEIKFANNVIFEESKCLILKNGVIFLVIKQGDKDAIKLKMIWTKNMHII